MKVAIITDTHTGARSESLVFNDYFIKFFEEQFFPYLEKNDIKTIIHLGDVFDRRKYVNFRILNTWNKKIFPRLNEYDTHIILGNHDVYYKNSNHINSVENLLSQYNFNIYIDPTEVKIGGLPILFVPWINKENEEQTLKLIKSTNTDICMGHLELKGFEMFNGQISDHGYEKKIFRKFDKVFSGHYHHKSESNDIHYLGSPYHMTWADWGDPRGFHIFDTKTRELEFIENPLQIFYKLYYDDTKETYESIVNKDYSVLKGMYVKVIVKEKTNYHLFDQFLSKINEVNPTDISVTEAIIEDAEDEEFDTTKDTLTLLQEYVDELDVGEQTPQVKSLLTELFVEALSEYSG
jgi:DNA repair exonuclease SbcCD nuclease subunit